MTFRSAHVLFGIATFFAFSTSATQGRPRETMSLDGVWDFATDPESRGEAENWQRPGHRLPAMPRPGYAPTAGGTIRVPGIWDNQGYGTETARMRHSFIGKGWYKRQIEIPQSWAGRRVFLAVTGVFRYAKVWINDQFLGEHVGFLSAFEYDLGPHAKPGQTVTITIQVDSKQRWPLDAMFGCSALADYIDEILNPAYVDAAWGGIWGHVRLEARSDAWLSDLYVQPDVPHASCTVSATLNGQSQSADGAKLEVFDQSGRRVAEAAIGPDTRPTAGQMLSLEAPLPGAKHWTPDSPTLYTARLSLRKGDQTIDTRESRFGMRQFAVDGRHLLLNGRRLMLCGYGDDHVYPEQMAMPSDKELHLKRLRTIKSYGFNHVRHHSTIMPPEYYDACDEVGIIATAEFPICYTEFLPGCGPVWQRYVPKGTDPAAAEETYRREWTAVVRQYRNHPSIMAWVMGNELYWDRDERIAKLKPLRDDFRRIARQYDPGRLFLDADGQEKGMAEPKHDRDTLAYYSIAFDHTAINTPDKFEIPRPIKPVISHESGNFITFSRPDLIDQFRHNIKPYWLTAGRAKLEKLGLLAEANQWAEKSERLYLLCHKYDLEAIRRNPNMSGYHWWLFQDYWTTSNGIVDIYFRPKSIGKEEVLKINNDVVLLQDGLQTTYRGGDRLKVKLLVSNFSPKPFLAAGGWDIGCDSVGGALVFEATTWDGANVPQGEIVPTGHISKDLPKLAVPTRLMIKTKLVAEKTYQNDWTAWLYPAEIKPDTRPAPVFADEEQIKKLPHWGLKPLPTQGPLSERAVYAVSRLADRRLVDALERGASVVVFGGLGHALPFRTISYPTSWWKGTENGQVNYSGTMVYDHPVTRAMAPQGWCDQGWCYLIDGAKKQDLEAAPARPDVLIRALPTLERVEDAALLYQVGVGKGCLIVSSLNHERAAGRPENDWLLARLLEYAAQGPRPKARWPLSFVRAIYASFGSRLPGFGRLVSNEGVTSNAISYREDRAAVYYCFQNKPGNVITWKTAPVPTDLPADYATFVFAGGLGYRSAPASKGFVLEIGGREVLRFDVTPIDGWQSADRRVDLKFDALRYTPGGDPVGMFYLKVPRELLRPGQPCRLSVRSLGSGTGRWFALNPYTDTK